MKHLYFIVATVLLPLLISCHTKKQAIETVREETNTSRQTLFLIDSGKLDSMRTSFLAEFDSLVIHLPVPPIQCPGAGIVPDTATAPPRPVKATVYGGKVSTETKSVEPKPLKYISAILPRNENKSITRENKTAVIQHFSEYIRWEQYLKSF